MSIFSRLTDIVQSNLNSLLDRAEEPEKLIRLIIQEMEDTLIEVRSSTVKIIAEKKEIERRVADLRAQRDEWDRKAEIALTHNREDLAKDCLLAKSKVAEQADSLTEQLVHVTAALSKADEDMGRLQAKLTDAKVREKALVTRAQTAANRVKVRSSLHDERINEALSRFEEVERNLDELEGRVESYDIGRTRNLTEEIAELEATTKVEGELAALKARIAARRAG